MFTAGNAVVRIITTAQYTVQSKYFWVVLYLFQYFLNGLNRVIITLDILSGPSAECQGAEPAAVLIK